MIDDAINAMTLLASILAITWAVTTKPSRAGCLDGWYVNGIRPSGSFCCLPVPVGDPEWDGTWLRSPDRSIQPPGILCSQIYCTNGTHPIVVDFRVVGCQR